MPAIQLLFVVQKKSSKRDLFFTLGCIVHRCYNLASFKRSINCSQGGNVMREFFLLLFRLGTTHRGESGINLTLSTAFLEEVNPRRQTPSDSRVKLENSKVQSYRSRSSLTSIFKLSDFVIYWHFRRFAINLFPPVSSVCTPSNRNHDHTLLAVPVLCPVQIWDSHDESRFLQKASKAGGGRSSVARNRLVLRH